MPTVVRFTALAVVVVLLVGCDDSVKGGPKEEDRGAVRVVGIGRTADALCVNLYSGKADGGRHGDAHTDWTYRATVCNPNEMFQAFRDLWPEPDHLTQGR